MFFQIRKYKKIKKIKQLIYKNTFVRKKNEKQYFDKKCN